MTAVAELPPIAILAGGLATRLRPLTDTKPKSLIPVNGRPFIEHQLEALRAGGFRRAVICAGFLGDWIADCIQDGHRFGLDVRYSFDGPVLLGTGGAICKALPLLGSEFFVIYGDSYLCCDHKAVFDSFRRSNKMALMTVFQNDGQWDRSNVEFSKGEIRDYSKQRQTKRMRHIDYGLGVFRDIAFHGWSEGMRLDLAPIYEHLLATGQLTAFEATSRFYEIGSFQGIEDLSRHLRRVERSI